jgi:putative peptidoglycan lipid II flippase
VLVALREPIVAVLFERLAFDEQATQRTATALLAYAPQLPFVVVDQLLIVAFYARKRTITPVLVGVASAAVYLVVAFATVAQLGMAGLALANAVQNSAHAIVLYAILVREQPAMRHASLGGFGARIAVSSVLCALTLALGATLLAEPLASSGLLARPLAVTVVAVVAIGAYALALVVLRAPERAEIAAILGRFARPRQRDGEQA